MGDDSDSNKLKDFLHAKIAKREKQIHPAHNPRFNHDLQLEIDCIEWCLTTHWWLSKDGKHTPGYKKSIRVSEIWEIFSIHIKGKMKYLNL